MTVSTSTPEAKGQHQADASPIPDYLVYEIVRGKPIYYKGYRDVLNKTKTFEEIKMESTLQAWLKAKITILLGALLTDKGYEIATGELGFYISKDDKRGADISIFKSENLVLNEHFSKTPPEVIIEIDVMADTTDNNAMDYIHQKIEDYHQFGVEKVIWIFTKTKKVMSATPQMPWLTMDWDSDVEVMENASLNLKDLLGERND
ncbi:MAG: Uma2 family endonuclease [Bacteroidota bacterium]